MRRARSFSREAHAVWRCREIIARRGFNPDLVQVITGYGETGAALVSSGVDKILFIGSPGVGRRVMEAASKTLTPVVLELGGKVLVGARAVGRSPSSVLIRERVRTR